MGIFSGTRIVEVDSVVYNLAGDEETRPDYLKSLVVRNVLSGTKDSISQTMQNGLLNGPTMQLKSFYRWARQNQNFGRIGMPTGTLGTTSVVNSLTVQNAIAELTGQSAWVQSAQLRPADADMWVEQYILRYASGMVGTEWTADISDDGSLITITWPGPSYTVFSPENFDPAGQYVFAYYNRIEGSVLGPLTPGTEVDLGTGAFPSLNGWTYEGKTTTGTFTETVYSKLTYSGSSGGGAQYLQEVMYLREETSPLNRKYQVSSRTITGLDHNQTQIFIYKLGSGYAPLDVLAATAGSMGQFFPSIPVRLNRTFLGENTFGETYKQAKKAYKKATGGKFEKLIDKIGDNEKINDIDGANIVFGVSLNVKDNACRRYLYEFFLSMAQSQVGGPGAYALWKSAMEAQLDKFEAWQSWKNDQAENGMPQYGDPEPPRPAIPNLSGNYLRVNNSPIDIPFQYRTDMRLSWLYVSEVLATGQGKPGAKKGECWFEILLPDSLIYKAYGGGPLGPTTDSRNVSRVRLYWQKDDNSYSYLDIVGLEFSSFAYGAKAVVVRADDALRDTDESNFIVPLHYGIWSNTSPVQSNQMGTACCFLVLTTYKITKTKWYQNGFFQILIVVAIAVLSALFTGGAGFGLLGSHMAVGQALGLTGMAAAIVGSVANSLAALIISTLVSELSTALFGPQFGAIVSSLFMLALGSMANSFHTTGSFAIEWGSMLKVENLMKLTNVIGSVFTGTVEQEIAGIGKSLETLAVSSKGEAEKIQQAYFAEFGYGAGRIDPMMFVDVASSSRILAEAPDTFLKRTLMTGSEIAELSKDLLSNYSEYSIKLPEAFVS